MSGNASIPNESTVQHFQVLREDLDRRLEAGEISAKSHGEAISRQRKKALEAGLSEDQIGALFPRGRRGKKANGTAEPDAGPLVMAPADIPVNQISASLSLQMREDGIDAGVRREYAEVLEAQGWVFPSVVVYRDGDAYHLADGFHRHAAALDCGASTIPAEVRQGDRNAALLHACGSNAEHGKRRTAADKRKAIRTLIESPEWSDRSDNWIAGQVRCSPSTVGMVRLEIESERRRAEAQQESTFQMESDLADQPGGASGQTGAKPSSGAGSGRTTRNSQTPGSANNSTRKTRDGRTMNTSNIGAAAKKPKQEAGTTTKKPSAPSPAVLCEHGRHEIVAALAKIRNNEQSLHPSAAFKLCEVLIRYFPKLKNDDRAAVLAKICGKEVGDE